VTMPDSWFYEQIAAKKTVAKIMGGRRATVPERVRERLGWPPSGHGFDLRLPEGLLLWFEVWCNHDGVIEAKRREAEALVRRGFRCAFLPTTFSTRCIGLRRPLLVTPLDSAVDFDQIAQRLVESNYVGVRMPELTATV
jgi:hypothetical protein